MNVLVLNAGSSSLKFQLIAIEHLHRHQDQRLVKGAANHFGNEAEFVLDTDGRKQKSKAAIADIPAALNKILEWLKSEQLHVDAVGHRIVHGGEQFSESALITDEVLQGIRDCADLAPLHNPKNIEGIEAAQKFFGRQTPQVAVFDTAFHHTLPERAYIYALPYELYQLHKIRRYGFHGTSFRYVTERYRSFCGLTTEQTNVICLHLGNGCSAAAIKGGNSFDTSMGMTPLDGLVMGTRSGEVDPGSLPVIARKQALSLDQVETMLNEQSGLLGISGVSNDMQELQSELERGPNKRVSLAIEIFCYRARKYVGAYLAAMGGADAIIFTGGIGENSAAVRAQICDGLQWAGLELDSAVNDEAIGKEALISAANSKLRAYCIPTDEELLIARDTARCILGQPAHKGI